MPSAQSLSPIHNPLHESDGPEPASFAASPVVPGVTPAWLLPHEGKQLLAEVAHFIRPFTVYILGLRVGLRCREIAALDVLHVSEDGREPRTQILCPGLDRRFDGDGRRVVQVPPEARRALARYLSWRRGRCPHPDRPMRTEIGSDGRSRCATCGDIADFLAAPLFLSRRHQHLSPRRLRAEFASHRDAAGLRSGLHFDSMHLAYEADHPRTK